MANNYDLSVIQGMSYAITLNATGADGGFLNLNGYTGQGYVKYRYSNTGHLLDLSPLISSPASGVININLTSTQTTNLPVLQALYDIKATSGINTIQVFKGYFNIYPVVSV